MKRACLTFCLMAATVLMAGAPVLKAQQPNVTVYTKTDMQDLVQRMEHHSDAFKKHFDKALDRSTLDGTDREDRLKRWTADLESQMDHFKDDYSHDRLRNVEERVNTLLAIAAGINRAMLYRTFDHDAERDWGLLRSDLNALAIMYALPILQSYRVTAYSASR